MKVQLNLPVRVRTSGEPVNDEVENNYPKTLRRN